MRNNRWPMPAGRAALAALAATLLLGSCAGRAAVKPSAAKSAGWHLPWHQSPPAAPVPVNELALQSDSSVPLTVQQFWNRNTLRVDLGSLGGSGTLRLLPSIVNGWPARLEFAVRPGGIAQLEVRGDQRVVFTVPAAASDGLPQVLSLPPSVYSASTAAIAVTWN